MKKTVLALTMAFLAPFASRGFSQDFLQSFNANLTSAEVQDLKDGKVVIRNLKSTAELSLSTANVYANKFVGELKATAPTHLAEVVQVRAYKGNENLIQELSALVSDIPSYRQIPYYTERHGAWAAMFTKAQIVSSTRTNVTAVYNTLFTMPPFPQFSAQVTTTQLGDTLYFATVNKEKIKYKIFNAVKPEKMECGLVLFRQGDYWILYGAGAVRAEDSFFIKSRVNTAFVNRIKDFSMYFIKKLG